MFSLANFNAHSFLELCLGFPLWTSTPSISSGGATSSCLNGCAW
jgi:hypothetical protein